MPSYKDINYSIRPAKCVERKMLVEVFQRLASFFDLDRYEYIGFGSTYFSDFSLFHKTLDLKKMVSIEKDRHNADRFNFNVPYSCIEVKFGHSNEVLPTLIWDACPRIFWLDYDGALNTEVLADIRTICANALEGTLLIVSVNAQPFQPDSSEEMPADGLGEYRMNKVNNNIGEEKLPIGTEPKNLSLSTLSKLYRQVVDDEIKSSIRERNGGIPDDNPNKFKYNQVINVEYQDGAKMLTVGGIITKNYQSENLSSAKFDALPFHSDNDAPFKIQVPKLTFREINYLESLLPSNIDTSTGNIIDNDKTSLSVENLSTIIPLKDIKKFSSVYRHFPMFAESNH